MKLIDLSITIKHQAPCDPPIQRPTIHYYSHEDGVASMIPFFPGITKEDLPDGKGWAVEVLDISTHAGTHMDAPWHYAPVMDGGKPAATIDQVPLDWCWHDAVKFDFSDRPAGTLITSEDFKAELKKMRYELKPLDIVLLQSGAADFIDSEAYVLKGVGVGKEGTVWLTDQGIKVVGTDAWSWDRPLPIIAQEFARTKDAGIVWEGHYAGRVNGYYQMEKLANLDKLPSHGFQVICFPVKIAGASAGWTRPVAVLP
jgi:kynurenine formamidase